MDPQRPRHPAFWTQPFSLTEDQLKACLCLLGGPRARVQIRRQIEATLGRYLSTVEAFRARGRPDPEGEALGMVLFELAALFRLEWRRRGEQQSAREVFVRHILSLGRIPAPADLPERLRRYPLKST